MMQFLVDDRRFRMTCGLRVSLFLLPLLLIGNLSPSTAQTVRVSASTDSVTVGDRFQLHIAADYPDGMRVVLPSFSQGDSTLGDLTILKQVGFPQRSTTGSYRTDSLTYEVTTFTLDSARVPPVTVEFAREGDTLASSSPPLTIDVGSLVPEDAQDLRGLSPLATFPGPLWPWVLGGGLALILAAVLLYLFLKQSEDEEPETVHREPDMPPYTEAMTRLQELETVDLEGTPSVKPFFIELSDLLRTYISRTTDVPAREVTTHELINLLGRRDGQLNEIYTDHRIERIDVILRLSDLVKFADRKPKPEDSRSALGATRKTIDSLEQKLEELKQEQKNADQKARVDN